MKYIQMKRFVFSLTALFFVLCLQAQNYDDISAKLLIRQYKQAKEDLDKRMTNAKFISKPEAYILKTAVYTAVAYDSASAAGAGDQLLSEAEAAFAKYKEMDGPEYKLVTEVGYKEGPINLYSLLYSKGFKAYQAKSWEQSFQTFKKVVDISYLLIAKKIINATIDTNTVILTAYTAENSNHKDEAAKYYGKLADAKVGGEGNDFIYRFLVVYNFEKGDMAGFEKYKALGKELYPASEYFGYDKVDFASGLAEGFNGKIKALEDVLAKDPDNYKALLNIIQLISDTLHPREGAVAPANADELEVKMVTALNKAATSKSSDELVFLLWGDHFIDKADKVNDERAQHVEDMKKRTKPGGQPSKEDIAKRDALDKKYGEAFDKAREPYERAAAMLAAKTELTRSQKQQYKKVAGYLGDIYNYKKVLANQAKNTADVTKYTAEAKKWNDLYDTIK